MVESNHTEPSRKTREAEGREATSEHTADRMPTADEEAMAPEEAAPGVADGEKEMARRGADVKGEGRLN